MEHLVYPLRASHVLTQQVPNKLVLLTPDDGQYFSLNDVGATVWELCDGTRSVDDIVAAVAKCFEAPFETVQVDVGELLDDLASQRLVVEPR